MATQTAAFTGWHNVYRAHGARGYAVPASRYAGMSLPKPGLSSVFGFGMAGSTVDTSARPWITKRTRTAELALALS